MDLINTSLARIYMIQYGRGKGLERVGEITPLGSSEELQENDPAETQVCGSKVGRESECSAR